MRRAAPSQAVFHHPSSGRSRTRPWAFEALRKIDDLADRAPVTTSRLSGDEAAILGNLARLGIEFGATTG